ncbi:MAG: UbiA family prenyltransferase [Bacteroidota bacterium]
MSQFTEKKLHSPPTRTVWQDLVKHRAMLQFFSESFSLILAGFLVSPAQDWGQLLVLTWFTFSGVTLVYRQYYFYDQGRSLKDNLLRLKGNKWRLLILGQFLFLCLPVSFFYLSWLQIQFFTMVGLLGIIYSLKINLGEYSFRLKRFFLIKNITIGAGWGALVLIGANNFTAEWVLGVFGLAALQVLIGSAVRDVKDIDKDIEQEVNSIGVVLGREGAIYALHLFNLCTLALGAFTNWDPTFMIYMAVIVLWRIVILLKIQFQPWQTKWFHQYNLLTCSIISALALIIYLYGIPV